MASDRTFEAGPRARLAGDGGLLTAGVAGILLGLSLLGVAGPFFVSMAAVLLAPLLAWSLHDRHIDGVATIGAILGFVAGSVVVSAAIALGMAFGLTQTNVPGTVLGAAMVVGAAYLAVALWLDIDALRDLSGQARAHVWLDVLRLLATAAYFAFLVGWILWATGPLSDDVDRVMVPLLVVGPGVLGAAATLGADLLVRRHERRSHAHLISGV